MFVMLFSGVKKSNSARREIWNTKNKKENGMRFHIIRRELRKPNLTPLKSG